ncbi:ImmA/IrrE family metallo-endopeptidase [Leucobacter zeae]|nr:ImmA/IrrE family metallo-endopeptidase [Leucobacter zeae]
METGILDRVKQLVAKSGRSNREFAAEMFLDETKFSKAMSGTRRFSAVELASLAEVGGTTVDWILTGIEPRDVKFAFRAQEHHNKEDLAATLSEEVEMLVERRTSFVSLGELEPLRPLQTPPDEPHFVTWSQKAAAFASARLSSPVQELSNSELIDAIELAFDVDVVVGDLPERCDGASYSDDDARVIVLQRTSNAARQRFTLAHELGHILHGDTEGSLQGEQLFTADQSRAEARANVFAGLFLAPDDAIRQSIAGVSALETFAGLVHTFKISPHAMVVRLLKLQMISPPEDEDLKARSFSSWMSDLGVTQMNELALAEAEAMRARRPQQLVSAALRAVRAGKISVRPLAMVLGLNESEARKVMWSDEVGGPRL